MAHRGGKLPLMELVSGGKITAQTRLRLDDATQALLCRYAERFGRELRRLQVLLSKGVRLSNAKRQFIEEGLTARQFNSVAAVLRGIVASRKSSLEREIHSKTRRARAIEKRLRLSPSRGGYSPQAAHQKKRVLGRLKNFLEHSRDRKPPITFGGRKLWNAQHHLKENGYASHEEWLKAWREARSGEFFLIGSKDESFGNQSCQFNPHDKTLRVRLPDALGGLLEIPGVSFPYQGALLERAVHSGVAVSYRFVRKPKGWYLHATTQASVGELCTNRAWGALGVDVGPDRIGVVETDRAGNPVARKTFPLPLYHKTKTQARALVGEVAVQIGAWAVRCGKPVALEELDFEGKKAELRERGKGLARMLSSFAYGALSEAVRSRCAKMGVEVIGVDPAHSSTIGIVKFAAQYGLSGDEAAALVLARRALNLGESLPAGTALGRPEDRPRHVRNPWQRFGKALRSKGRHAFVAAKRGPGGRRVHPAFPARASPA
jgi:IS605 OrfB family transposase